MKEKPCLYVSIKLVAMRDRSGFNPHWPAEGTTNQIAFFPAVKAEPVSGGNTGHALKITYYDHLGKKCQVTYPYVDFQSGYEVSRCEIMPMTWKGNFNHAAA